MSTATRHSSAVLPSALPTRHSSLRRALWHTQAWWAAHRPRVVAATVVIALGATLAAGAWVAIGVQAL
jgi:hypothetical protein